MWNGCILVWCTKTCHVLSNDVGHKSYNDIKTICLILSWSLPGHPSGSGLSERGRGISEGGTAGTGTLERILWVLWRESWGHSSMVKVHPVNSQLDWDLGSVEARITHLILCHVPRSIPEWYLWSERVHYTFYHVGGGSYWEGRYCPEGAALGLQ